ncbi:MAG: xanthine dehydrogenase family protein subunit M [Burkholderiales bacterium]|nr:xanthine dehydrogenase family protein subunit M [Burkholderiales bacterium]
MYPLTYARARTLSEARELLAKHDEARLLAGGMTLIPTLKARLAAPSLLVDIGQVQELQGIEAKGDRLVIGAGTRYVDIARSALVKRMIPALAYLVSRVGDPQVRNRGTMGGSVANNDPVADSPAAVLALGATVRTERREIAADEYFKGLFETALAPGEIITGFSFPVPARAAYWKFAHPASGYAMAGAFVADFGGAVRVAVTGASSSGVYRWKEAEDALGRRFAPAALDALEVSPDGMSSDIHGSADYRANLVQVMARRAVDAIAAGR